MEVDAFLGSLVVDVQTVPGLSKATIAMVQGTP